jgi:hypothetical protein
MRFAPYNVLLFVVFTFAAPLQPRGTIHRSPLRSTAAVDILPRATLRKSLLTATTLVAEAEETIAAGLE